MKHKSISLFLAAAFLFTSCNQSSGKITFAQVNIVQHATLDNMEIYRQGEEMKADLREVAQDRSAERLQSRAKKLFLSAERIDASTKKILTHITEMRLDILKECGVNVNRFSESRVIREKPQAAGEIRPLSLNLHHLDLETAKNVSISTAKRKQLQSLIKAYRAEITSVLVSSASTDERTYFFKDPNIENSESTLDLNTKIRESINENVAVDDWEILAQIYISLTYSDEFIEKLLPENLSWIDAIGVLTNLENDIYEARYLAIAAIRYRVSGENYSFNKIAPAVFGPSILKKGKRIKIQVTIAAFDTDKQPIVTVNGGNVAEVKEGKAYVEVGGNKPGKKTISGTITILNKSGVPKTLPWEKEIIVID